VKEIVGAGEANFFRKKKPVTRDGGAELYTRVGRKLKNDECRAAGCWRLAGFLAWFCWLQAGF